jgi:hypothetical protein
MSSFINDEVDISGEDSSDDSEKSDDTFELDRRKDNKNVIHPEDYVPKKSKNRKQDTRKNKEESEKCANLELPIYIDYIEKTVSQRKMWLPRDPFEPMRHIEVQENQHLIHSTDE